MAGAGAEESKSISSGDSLGSGVEVRASYTTGGMGRSASGTSGTSSTDSFVERACNLGCFSAMERIFAATTVVKVWLGDGVVRVKAGERVRQGSHNHRDCSSTSLVWSEWLDGGLVGGLSEGDDKPLLPPVIRPAQPPGAEQSATSNRECYFVGCGGGGDGYAEVVESRRICFHTNAEVVDWGECVVVIQEGLALPTQTLLDITNTVYAVLVLRGDTVFYLHNDFVLSAEEEDSLVEWGIGRPVFSGILLAVGGVLLVALAEQVWRPAVVGILLVAAAQYRIQGALTKILRISSSEWKRYELVPAGIHGTERMMQSLLLTMLALADLLDSRVLLIAGLAVAALQVVLVEVVGAVVITWGFRYLSTLSQFLAFIFVLGFTWIWGGFLVYVFAGSFFFHICLSLFFSILQVEDVSWWAALSTVVKEYGSPSLDFSDVLKTVALVGVGVLDCMGLDIKICLTPWKWPLFQAPDDIRSALRLPGLWLCVVFHCLFPAFLIWSMYSFKMKSDRCAEIVGMRGARGSSRLERGLYKHYSVSSIPSRHVFHDVDGVSSGGGNVLVDVV